MLDSRPQGDAPRKNLVRSGAGPAVFAEQNASPLRLAKAIRIGMVRGVVRLTDQTGNIPALARELIRQDMFVAVTSHIDAFAAAGLLDPEGREAAGVGLAEFCAICDIPPVWNMAEEADGAPLRAFCGRLAEALGAPLAALPVVGLAGEDLNVLAGPGLTAPADPGAVATAISRVITVKRLSLGLNDRFDGSVYS